MLSAYANAKQSNKLRWNAMLAPYTSWWGGMQCYYLYIYFPPSTISKPPHELYACILINDYSASTCDITMRSLYQAASSCSWCPTHRQSVAHSSSSASRPPWEVARTHRAPGRTEPSHWRARWGKWWTHCTSWHNSSNISWACLKAG